VLPFFWYEYPFFGSGFRAELEYRGAGDFISPGENTFEILSFSRKYQEFSRA